MENQNSKVEKSTVTESREQIFADALSQKNDNRQAFASMDGSKTNQEASKMLEATNFTIIDHGALVSSVDKNGYVPGSVQHSTRTPIGSAKAETSPLKVAAERDPQLVQQEAELLENIKQNKCASTVQASPSDVAVEKKDAVHVHKGETFMTGAGLPQTSGNNSEHKDFVVAESGSKVIAIKGNREGNPPVVIAERGSEVSAGNGSVVIAENGSQVNAEHGARVLVSTGGDQKDYRVVSEGDDSSEVKWRKN